jgi:hypothetical protein
VTTTSRTETYPVPDDLSGREDPRALYISSYLSIRRGVGLLGVALPTLLFLNRDAVVRGSLSAYYHSPARDLFVGGLCIVGVLLLTYMASQKANLDYLLSTVAGVAVLGVAFFPMARPGAGGEPPCGSVASGRPGCTRLQAALGETFVATVHFVSAAVFILALAAICFVFARRERRHPRGAGRAAFHRACGVLILAAVAWVVVGWWWDVSILGLTALYVGEVVSVYAFGASWLVKAHDLSGELSRKLPAHAGAS